jgi:DNA-binding FadR family transcriptional regulator
MASLSFTIRQILETTFKAHQTTKGAKAYGFTEDLAFHRRVLEKISRRQVEAAGKAMSRLVTAAEHDLTTAPAKRVRKRS